MQHLFITYFSRVGVLSGCSFPGQRKVECELQTVTYVKARSVAAHQSVGVQHALFPYAQRR